ncbi:MAG: bifunctional 3-deoxy-7-phosphoheptulonate synthase/chorismate mutase [Planctomycetes bacterium]|nr:bifunctional 3-deoxy-7-phosphoheptulonate synthase/chorismate mutase [Planctomycetota bacterium]MCW8136961.1 bifunctional 3-deoxy-7-phosphoheptulonate synthase/chorismate mutase [Planctomycetota bacterium]
MNATINAPRNDEALVLGALRANIDRIDRELIELIARRVKVAADIGLAKRVTGKPLHDPSREDAVAQSLSGEASRLGLPSRLGRELALLLARHGFAAQLQQSPHRAGHEIPRDSEGFRLARWEPGRHTIVAVGEARFGAGLHEVIAGPCAVESEAQIELAADHARACGVRVLRGGAFKPRTSPYDFQGTGMQGVRWLAKAAHSRGMACVTEVLDPAHAAEIASHADLLQIGARNMQNVPLLRACAQTGKPILLKRGAAATLRELLCAAEYALLEGGQVILCERGLRTFERETRNTLDLSAVPALRQLTHLPVIVDPSHAAGKDELILPLCRAALAVGADGAIVEMHPDKCAALCDQRQALRPSQLREICDVVHLVRYDS